MRVDLLMLQYQDTMPVADKEQDEIFAFHSFLTLDCFVPPQRPFPNVGRSVDGVDRRSKRWSDHGCWQASPGLHNWCRTLRRSESKGLLKSSYESYFCFPLGCSRMPILC
jgi:hypothetical protein